MKHTCKTYDELNKFVEPLIDEGIWEIMITGDETEGFEIQWLEKKTYVAHDGKVFQDEVWVTKAGEMILVQDLDAAHAQNIIRMMIRRQRELEQATDDLVEQLIDMIRADPESADTDTVDGSTDDFSTDDFSIDNTQPRVLH